ncbi:hypothetical protein niasHS_009429 [Heterodera schachtii]|uniref:Uncharacterized protein n=1 Tax=Heterodera schachtii TaxID=97005 RepID=A0ABD2JC11_HETSC
MELMGLVLGTRLAAFVKAQLHRPISEEHTWSDSMIALQWVKNRTPQPQFVANRLAEIRRATATTFHHVPTGVNPADSATRGLSPAQLQNYDLWWQGPKWLTSPCATWPKELDFQVDSAEDEEILPDEATTTALVTRREPSPEEPREWSEELLNRCSKWVKALRVMAWARRFANNARRKAEDKARNKGGI